MPVYQVTDPATGTILRLTGDSPPTEAELEEIFSAHAPQGAPPAIPQMSLTGENPVTAASSGALQGLAGLGDILSVPIREGGRALGFDVPDRPVTSLLNSAGLAQPAQTDTGQVFERIGRFGGEGGIGAAGAAGMVRRGLSDGSGLVANLLKPAAQAPGRTAALEVAAGGGAGAGSLVAESIAPDSDIGQILGILAGAGTASVAVPKVAQAVSRGVQRLVGRPNVQVFDDAGQFTDEAIGEISRKFETAGVNPAQADAAVAEELVKDGVLTPEQAARFNLFQSRGVTPLRANVTRSTDDARELEDAVKRSGPVAEAVASQDQQLAGLVEGGVERLAPTATNLPETNASVFRVVDDVVTRADEAVSAAYAAARERAKGQPLVGFDELAKAINENRGSELARPVLTQIKTVLRNKGLIKVGEDIDINKRGSRVFGGALRKTTVREAEEIRQELNAIFDSVSPQGRRVIRQLKNALDIDVETSVGSDLFEDARAAKIAERRMVERGKRNKFDKTRGGLLEDIIDNKIPEEKIVSRLLAGRDDDFVNVKRFLLDDAGPAGEQAWNNIKAHVLRDALEQATKGSTKREGGVAFFNHRLFANQIAKLRKSGKWAELFDASERKLIEDVIQLGSFRAPISGVERGSGPSGFAVNSLKREIARRIPVIGEGALGLFDDLSNRSVDKRILDPTRQTVRALQGK